MHTALIVGEALVDIVHDARGGVAEHPGGGPANVAVGLSRLGRPTTLVTMYAEDRLGALLDGHLLREGVEVVRQQPPSGRTSSAQATLAADGSASYEFDLDWSVRSWVPEEQPAVMYVGSLGAALLPGRSAVLETATALHPGTTVVYDLNIRPSVLGPLADLTSVVLAFVEQADVVKASDEDLEHLFPGVDPLDSARRLLEHGPAAIVLTRGGAGSTAVTAGGQVDVAAPRVAVADTIGAGDSFCAAVIDALWDLDVLGAEGRQGLAALGDGGWRKVLEHATAAAAITVTRPGADPPRRDELP